MSRIGTYGASQMYLSRLNAIQLRMNKTQVQVATELKSTTYSGIAADTNRVINLENEKSRADAYVRDNTLADTRLKATTVSLSAMEKSLNNFKKRLEDFASGINKEPKNIQQLQQWAFDAMKDMQSYLAASVDGQYIFSGGRVSDEPVKLPADSLSEFQKIFDGSNITYPTTREASLAEVHLTGTETGPLTFDTATGTIRSTTNAFDKLAAGTRITLGGLSPAATFTIQGVDPATHSIKVSQLNTETNSTTTTLSFTDAGVDYDVAPSMSGGLTFSPEGDTITSTVPGMLDITKLAPGSHFSIKGSAQGNDGNYEVLSNDGTTIKIKSTKLDFVQPTTNEAAATLTTASATNYTSAGYGQLTFGSNASGQLTISSTNLGAFTNAANEFAVGSTFTIAGGTAGGNDGTYRVLSNTAGQTLTVTRIDGGNYTVPQDGGAKFDAESWYRGDNLQLQHKIDTDRSVDLGIYASDPAFDKAFRALGLIAQGAYGTPGGLENNLDRINQARALIQDAISRNTNAPGPFGTEKPSDLTSLAAQVGVTQNLIKTKNDKHTAFSGFLDTRIADLERVDKTEAVARLLDDQTALQTSYQALATVRGMSLLDYMK